MSTQLLWCVLKQFKILWKEFKKFLACRQKVVPGSGPPAQVAPPLPPAPPTNQEVKEAKKPETPASNEPSFEGEEDVELSPNLAASLVG